MTIAKIQAPPLARNVAETAESKKADDAKKAGQEFEAILVRQMLAQTNLGGKGGYADMATEALATAVTKGGGLGLGRILEHQLAPAADRSRIRFASHSGPESDSKSGLAAAPSAAVSAFKRLSEK